MYCTMVGKSPPAISRPNFSARFSVGAEMISILMPSFSCSLSMVHRPLRKGMFSRSEPQIVMVTGSSADAAAIKVSGSRQTASSSARRREKCFMVLPPSVIW